MLGSGNLFKGSINFCNRGGNLQTGSFWHIVHFFIRIYSFILGFKREAGQKRNKRRKGRTSKLTHLLFFHWFWWGWFCFRILFSTNFTFNINHISHKHFIWDEYKIRCFFFKFLWQIISLKIVSVFVHFNLSSCFLNLILYRWHFFWKQYWTFHIILDSFHLPIQRCGSLNWFKNAWVFWFFWWVCNKFSFTVCNFQNWLSSSKLMCILQS